MIIERACAILDPAAVRQKLARAPDWVKRGEKRSPRPAYAGVLCGVAAPGVSVPVPCELDGRELRETFHADGWHETLAAITKEKPVRLEHRHHGGQFATTADGTLRLTVHPILGLVVSADVADEPLARMLLRNVGQRGLGLSVAFTNPKIEYERVGREVVRVIRSCRLDHIALIAPGHRPAYEGAVAYVARPGDLRAIDDASRDARVAAWRHARDWRTRLAAG